MQGQTVAGGLSASQYINILTTGATMDMIRTDSSNIHLGSYDFISTGYKGKDTDSSSRLRVYATTVGSYLFVCWVAYDDTNGPSPVAQVQQALATLHITANTAIRPVVLHREAETFKPRLDALGRRWSGNAAHLPDMPYFLKR
jgi:hypothetical protein